MAPHTTVTMKQSLLQESGGFGCEVGEKMLSVISIMTPGVATVVGSTGPVRRLQP